MTARFPTSRFVGPLCVWLVTVLAGVGMAVWLGMGGSALLPLGVALCLPALLSLLLVPFVDRDWAQGLVLMIWTGFAVAASLAGGLNLLLATFLTVPAVGMLFFRGRVLEGLMLAAIGLVATVLSTTLVPSAAAPAPGWASLAMLLGTAATLALVVSAMIAGTDGRAGTLAAASPAASGWRDGVAGGLFEFDGQGRLIAANAQGQAQFGLDAVPGQPSLHQFAAAESAQALLVDTADTARRRASPVEARIALGPAGEAGALGGPTHVDARFTPLSGGGLLLHTVDRTDEEARLEALRRSHTVAEREAEDKTLFFAGVSHELRTPLNAIIGFSDMMRSRLFGPLPGKYAEYAELIHDSGHYMLDLIGDVLDLSKVEAGRYTLNPDTFDAADVVRSSVKMIRPASDSAEVAVDVALPEDDALLLTADRKAVRQILLNLLSNAVKFSPRGGRVRLAVEQGNGATEFSVSDQGPGMSAEDVARIGEPFAQGAAGLATEARGSGLGLSLVRQLAELHGGALRIDSQPGAGTTARVTIPDTH